MALRFSNNGPEFPSEFIDSLLSGETIFLSGTGVSAPQMPEFQCLVEHTYKTLAVEITDSEQSAFDSGRFEEVLGSLRRRLSDPNAVTRTVSELLTVRNDPNLDQHRTILRLSRDLDNRISVVTTNFDTLLERAAAEVMGDEAPREISFAGQALPAPGSPSFSGIIHIHGRLADNELNLEQTPLVLTSADYGDAYMRSGWASRFLFDLARCKAIVLVGYSANDAPVRYFLNVLEADRARFPDLKPVYAFHAYECDPIEAIGSWGTLAVVPLPYSKINPDTGKPDHSPLWRDLSELAEVAEHPQRSRRERAQAILAQPAANVTPDCQRELGWLLRGSDNLWPTALKAISDPGWFDFLRQTRLLSTDDAPWLIADWVSRNFQNCDRFERACMWQRRLSRPFTDQIAQRLLGEETLDETWTRIWRLFCLAKPIPDDYPAYYETKKRLTSGVVLDSDLRKAVGLLAPRLVLSQIHRESDEKNVCQPVRRLSDIVWPRLSISNEHSAEELVETLGAMPDRARQILDLATAELRSALRLQAELELIGEEHDVNDTGVPSIECHSQNQHHEGVNYLVRILVESLCQIATLDRDYARRVAIGWKRLPGRIGLRLCLHAMRNVQLFDADEAMATLLSASDIDFWEIRREIALLVKVRAGTASQGLVSRVEKRIRQTGDEYFDRYTIESGEADWRSHARDAAVWLRLNMLRDAGVLSEIGDAELSAIKERRDYLNRAVEDRDFFGAYSFGVRHVVGNPAPIAEATEDDRLRIAHQLIHSREFDLQQGWSAFCRSDPQGAFDSLCKGDHTPENGVLWNEFLLRLAVVDAENKALLDELSMRALDHLAGFSPDALKPMVSGLAYLMFSVRRQDIVNLDKWLERLWQVISDQPETKLDLTSDLYEQAINSNVGKLTETLLYGLPNKRQESVASREPLLRLAGKICRFDGSIGHLGRAVLTVNLAFLIATDRQFVIDVLAPNIRARNPQGAALRAVMLTYASITPDITHVLGQAILQGVAESDRDGHVAATIVSKILLPAVAQIRSGTRGPWGLDASQVADVLREASQPTRCGALEVLAGWLATDDAGPETAWAKTFGPFFHNVWPKEHEFRDDSLATHFVQLAVNADDAFPEAFKQLRPYIVPYGRRYRDLHPIVLSKVPEKFPRDTLSLLWLICGPGSDGHFFEISKIIDRLGDADTKLRVDRRLQWLEAHRMGFD